MTEWSHGYDGGNDVLKLIAWLVLLVISWPLALLALVLWPIVWLLSLPFRLVGITLDAVFELIGTVLRLPARLLRGDWRHQAA